MRSVNFIEKFDLTDQDFVKEELSLEKAKKLFEKRVGANTSDDHDDITDDEEYMEEIIKSKKGICPILTRVNLCLVLLLRPNKQPILDQPKTIWTRCQRF